MWYTPLMTTQQTDYYTETSRHYMAGAWKHLAEDDLLQASEKGWGAAAQMIKAVAESRGWEHNNHRLLYVAAARLADEAGDGLLDDLFHSAGSLHTNFYEGSQSRRMVTRGLTQVEELLGKLEPLVR